MALRSPAALSLGARYLYGSLSQATGTLSQAISVSSGSGSDKKQQEQQEKPGAPIPSLQLTSTFAAIQDDKQKQSSVLGLAGAQLPAAIRSLQPLVPSLPSVGARRTALARLGAPRGHLQQQVRGYNAWSPAGRYFVEGEHVITAEANRTFQFTGLDSGSFYPYVLFTIIATAISCVFVIAPLLIAPSRVDLDKSSAYECGFDAFGEARQTFSVSFYLVSIMYLLFDIEIAYLFPYTMTHASMPEYWTMQLFLAILVGGFAYEWGMGALEWRE